MDLLDEARVAHLMACARELSWRAFPAAAALQHATAGGADALGLWPGLGQLAVGAPADLCAFPLDGLAALPVRDVCDSLVHGVAGSPARLTVAAGAPRVLNGRLVTGADVADLAGRMAALGERMMAARDRRPE